MDRRLIAVALAAGCHAPRPPAVHVDLIYAAQAGVQLVAVIKIDAAAARHIGFVALRLEHDGATCAEPAGPVELARIARVTSDHPDPAFGPGGRWTGDVDAGSSYLRLRADVHCDGPATLVVDLDTGDTLLRGLEKPVLAAAGRIKSDEVSSARD